MIIDGHAHASREFASIDTLIASLDNAGVDKVVLCPSLKNNRKLGPPPKIFSGDKERSIEKLYGLNKMITLVYKFQKMQGDPNRFIFDLVQEAPERIIQFYWVDFRKLRAIEQVAPDFNRYGFKGIKIHQGWNPLTFSSPKFHDLLSIANALSLPMFIHPGTKKETLKLLRLLPQYPKVKFILAHLMGAELLKEYKGDNLFHDISPTNLSTPVLLDAVNHYGSERILFGSDMPFGDLESNLKKMQSLDLTSTQKEHILGRNMQGILGR